MEKRVSDRDWSIIDERGTPGIVVRDGKYPVVRPQIAAFVWGGKVRPVPTLPFGRWKPSPS